MSVEPLAGEGDEERVRCDGAGVRCDGVHAFAVRFVQERSAESFQDFFKTEQHERRLNPE